MPKRRAASTEHRINAAAWSTLLFEFISFGYGNDTGRFVADGVRISSRGVAFAQPRVRIAARDVAEARPQLRDAFQVRRECFRPRVTQRVFEQRIQLDRLAEADGFFGIVAHVFVFADQPVRRARRVLPLQIDALFARARLRVAALGAGDDDHFVALRLNVERALIHRRLHVVAAVRRQRGFGVGYADRLCDDARRILVRPDAADHAHRRRVFEQGVRSGVGRRGAHGIDHQLQVVLLRAPGSATRCSS